MRQPMVRLAALGQAPARGFKSASGLGIPDNSAFFDLCKDTQKELLSMYHAEVASTQEIDADIWQQLLEFEDETAKDMVHSFRNNKKVMNMATKKAYFIGFIKNMRRSGEGLRAPPERPRHKTLLQGEREGLPSLADVTRGRSGQRSETDRKNFRMKEGNESREIAEELQYLSSPMSTRMLDPEDLHTRFHGLLARGLRYVLLPDNFFVPPYRLVHGEEIMKAFCEHASPAKDDYDLMMQAYAKSLQPDKATQLLGQMTAAGIQPDLQNFKDLLHSQTHLKDTSAITRTVEMMTEAGLVPDAACNNSIIVGSMRANDLLTAIQTFDKLEASEPYGAPRSALSYIVKAYSKLGLRAEAQKHFDLLEARFPMEVQSSDVAAMLQVYLKDGDYAAALEMQTYVDAYPTTTTHGLIVKALVDSGDFEKAKKVFAGIPQKCINEHTLRLMMKVFFTEGDREQLQATFDMKSIFSETTPCLGLYMSYIGFMLRYQEVEKAEAVWDAFKTRYAGIQTLVSQRTAALKKQRGSWVDWHAKDSPYTGATYTSLIRLVTDTGGPCALGFGLDLVAEAKAHAKAKGTSQNEAGKLHKVVTTSHYWLSKMPDLSKEEIARVASHAAKLEEESK